MFHKDEAESLHVLSRAIDAGVNFFDTADNYSLGNSERLIGRVLRGRRDRIVIATKGGARFRPFDRVMHASLPVLRPMRRIFRGTARTLNVIRDKRRYYDYSAEHLTRAVEASLRRLGTDYIDIYQLYNPITPDIAGFEFCEVLERLKAQGKIRFYGVSVNSTDEALLCLADSRISSIQIALSLLDQAPVKRLLLASKEKSVAIIARSPLAQGLLTDATGETMADRSAHFSLGEIAVRRRCAERLRHLVTANRTFAQAALQYVLQLPGVSVVIPSAANRSELEENLGALEAPPLSPVDLRAIATTV